MESPTDARRPRLFPDVPREIGDELVTAVQAALAALEKLGVSAGEADEFVLDCVFEAWWDWDYAAPKDAR